jgi:alkylation response protein AidB-like acyl-CoA dehydrogenase
VFPESVGGTNLGYVAATVIQEEMARNDVRFAACNNQQGSTCPSCIYFGGTPEQITKYVPNLLAGKTIGMMSLTESGGGSDAAGAMKTIARRDGDVYRITGQKMFASIANETDVGVLFAKTEKDAFFTGEGSANVQKILIAEDAPGYKLADRHHGKTGLRDIRRNDVADRPS